MAATDVRISLDDKLRTVQMGATRVPVLRSLLEVPVARWLALLGSEFERFLSDAEEIPVRADLRLVTCEPLQYRPHPKHKPEPARGRKGTLCPTGVDGPGLLAQSYRLHERPRRRWATHDGLAYCAMDDNAGGWHGYPVLMTDVPALVWRDWLHLGKIHTKDLQTERLRAR